MSENIPPTIYVVEDDSAIRNSLSELLEIEDLRAEFYTNVYDFRAAYSPDRPGCLILDLWLPGCGFQLLEDLSVSENPIPTIVITGQGDTLTQRRALDSGAFAFLKKPFQVQELLENIKRAIEFQPDCS